MWRMKVNVFNNTVILLDYIKNIFPQVDYELNRWKNEVKKINCKTLAEQALLSIKHKKFHAQGGSIYALYPNTKRILVVRLIVALQTISDYLDNLCDRVGYMDEKGLRQLHVALEEALIPEQNKKSNYFEFYPYDDGGYLNSLVDECKHILSGLQNYDKVRESVAKQACLYSEMQTYKHIGIDEREEKIIKWARENSCLDMGISEWEYAAATGSTLAIFMLCSMAGINNLSYTDVNDVTLAYFPWVCGIHILLDYFIDMNEDYLNDDLNFVSYYDDIYHFKERFSFLLNNAIYAVKYLPNTKFHLLIIKGLLAMYLSDPKVSGKQMIFVRDSILDVAQIKYTKLTYYTCKLIRWRGRL